MALSQQALLPNLTAILLLLLSQLSLAAALPTPHHLLDQLHTRAVPDLSSASGKIAGGVFALILISLLFGLGAATVAIKGSVEWREFRDRNKPRLPAADEEKGTVVEVANVMSEKKRPDTTDSEKTAVAVVVVSEEEKEHPVTPTMSGASGEGEEVQVPPPIASPTPSERSARRLTLKSFLPVDFDELKVGWLKETNAK